MSLLLVELLMLVVLSKPTHLLHSSSLWYGSVGWWDRLNVGAAAVLSFVGPKLVWVLVLRLVVVGGTAEVF